MLNKVVVFTPSKGFGELIRQVLDDTGAFEVHIFQKVKAGFYQALEIEPNLVILDGDLSAPLDRLCNSFSKRLEDILFIYIPPSGDEGDPYNKSLPVHGVLEKPFYLPELLNLVEKVFSTHGKALEKDIQMNTGELALHPQPKNAEEPKPVLPPAWLRDVKVAAQHLTRLSLESSAQAALITHATKIYAYAGELSQPAVEELAEILSTIWVDGGGADLARFIKMKRTGGEFMLYATGLGGGYVLAMAFDTEMPFSKIRSTAGELAQSFISNQGMINPSSLNNIQTKPASNPFVEPAKSGSLAKPVILDDMDEYDKIDIRVDTAMHPASFLKDEVLDNHVVEDDPNLITHVDLSIKGITGDLEAEKTSEPDYLRDVTEPVSEDEALLKLANQEDLPLIYLTYQCVLVPRIPKHDISEDMARKIKKWLPHISLAFGWKIKNIVVQDQYLYWVVLVEPEDQPIEVVEAVRKVTSARLFEDYPLFEQENPSGDFWARGYLLHNGNHYLPMEYLNDFVVEIRKKQGISPK